MRGAVAQALSRSVVKLVGGVIDINAAHTRKAHALRKELAQQPIGVLVGAPLPRVIRVCKEHLSFKAVAKKDVISKLFAIVKCQRQTLRFVGTQHRQDGGADWGGFTVGQMVHQRIARAALHQSHQHPRVAPANDGIALPVTDTLPGLNDGWTLLDTDPALELPAAFIATGIALAPLLLAAQVAGQIPALSLVTVDVLVNALMADGASALKSKPSADLFG